MTTTVTLTDVPQLITSGAAFITSKTDKPFAFAFGSVPSNLSNRHHKKELYVDGSLGALYVWNHIAGSATKVVVSTS